MAKNTKWLLTKNMSLGFCRDSFKAGSVIVELDDSLLINGKEYKDNRDMEILKRQMLKNPDNAWIIPYNEDDERNLLENGKTDAVVRKRPPTDHSMPVIESDEDLVDEIDVSNTQISVINERRKAEEREKAKSGKLEIIPDHEDIEDRINRIAKKSDAAALAERVVLKSGGIQKMNVVHDDTLGAQYDSRKNPSLNAGTVIPAKHYATERINAETAGNEVQTRKEDEQARFLGIETAIKKIIKEYVGDLEPVLQSLKKVSDIMDKVDGLLQYVDKVEVLLKNVEKIEPLFKYAEKIGDVLKQSEKIGEILQSLKSLPIFARSELEVTGTEDSPKSDVVTETATHPDKKVEAPVGKAQKRVRQKAKK